ncbi:TolC family protein [Lentiprolixibacter aurantiacus]|uniref:TolC family protein n=1 Tax=Lentiprolixibacter aurantiacus TaxID=2993939 RepID=A0AAE3MJV2_9FLAO|nr:TolC family protein [Lentiprolixibacter aurantiacus]MCX2718462.1 TolC family protein [Lentiprolixibacter aurantiacus]
MRHIILFLLLSLQFSMARGQSQVPTYSLQECIDMALANNLDLSLAKLSTETAEVNFKQSRNELLPRLNGNYNIGNAAGRSINPFTNTYINEKLTFSNAGLSLDATVFNGFRLLNQWRMEKLNWQAAQMEKEDARNNLILNVTLAYLQVVNTKDLYNIAKSRLESTNGQLERLASMFEEEMGNPAEYRDFQGLRSNDESNLITAKNNYEDALTALKELLNTGEELDVELIDIPLDFVQYGDSLEEVYQLALENMASVKAGEFRLEASEKQVAVTRAGYVPEISFFANLNTNYSSVAQIFNETGTSIVETGDFVDISGTTYPVLTEESSFDSEQISYRDQFENNLFSTVGIQVNIPIFNGFQARNNVVLQKIKKEESRVNLDRIKLQLRTAIEQTYKDMAAAYERYQILQSQNEAYQESMRINEIRFINGVDNSVSYIIAKNNLETARVNLNNAKYEYLLRVKLLDFYKGTNEVASY